MKSHRLGKRGEQCALTFLTRKGYTIEAQGYRYQRSEIDLIARIDDILLFVEVKTRSHTHLGYPESFVRKRQKERYRHVALHYIEEKGWKGRIRFDIIALHRNEAGGIDLMHLEDAF